MQDETTDLTLELLYGVFAQQDVITRAARLTNHGDNPLRLDKAASACLDLPFGRWDLLHFHGRHAMERQLEREAVGTNSTAWGTRLAMWLAFPARWATPTAREIPSLELPCPSSARRSWTP